MLPAKQQALNNNSLKARIPALASDATNVTREEQGKKRVKVTQTRSLLTYTLDLQSETTCLRWGFVAEAVQRKMRELSSEAHSWLWIVWLPGQRVLGFRGALNTKKNLQSKNIAFELPFGLPHGTCQKECNEDRYNVWACWTQIFACTLEVGQTGYLLRNLN